jgi:hypothetical protein
MIITTTPTVEGKRIKDYRGIVTGEAILGATSFEISLPPSVMSLAAARLPMNENYGQLEKRHCRS